MFNVDDIHVSFMDEEDADTEIILDFDSAEDPEPKPVGTLLLRCMSNS